MAYGGDDAQLTTPRREACRHMPAPMTGPQRWYASLLRGHYGYCGLPNASGALEPGASGAAVCGSTVSRPRASLAAAFTAKAVRSPAAVCELRGRFVPTVYANNEPTDARLERE
jgi:hypothetical protein